MLLALCFVSFSAIAQIPNNKNLSVRPFDTLEIFKGNNNDLDFGKPFPGYLQKKQQQNLLAYKQRNVIVLQQDHMPCIVPNTNDIAKIPNAWPQVTVPYSPQYHPIPNPALPKNQPSVPDNNLDIKVK